MVYSATGVLKVERVWFESVAMETVKSHTLKPKAIFLKYQFLQWFSLTALNLLLLPVYFLNLDIFVSNVPIKFDIWISF